MSIAAANSYISVHKIVISSVLCSYSNLLYGSVHVDIIMYNYKCQFFGIRHDYQLDKSIWASQVYFFKNAIILWHKVLTAIRKIGLLVCESVFYFLNCMSLCAESYGCQRSTPVKLLHWMSATAPSIVIFE